MGHASGSIASEAPFGSYSSDFRMKRGEFS